MDIKTLKHNLAMKVLKADFEKGLDVGFVGDLALDYLNKGYLTEDDLMTVYEWYEVPETEEEVGE